MYQTLLTSVQDGTIVVTINRPEKLNALNKIVIRELSSVLTEIDKNPAIQSVILTGAGAKSFVAGADISEFQDLDAQGGKELARIGHEQVFNRIENSTKPMIAAVNGFALGGGCELALACHFRIASDNAKFGQPEVNLGLIPGYGGTQRLSQLIGKGRAMELIMTGTVIDAATAYQYGLVNHVVKQEELQLKALSIAATINTKAPLAIAACIQSINAGFDKTQNGWQLEIESFGQLFDTKDAREGATAFLEKRKPVFKGH